MIVESVPIDYVPWSIGGNKYPNSVTTGGGKYYGKAVNTNTINIEICGDQNGKASAKTQENAIALGRELIKKYNIDIEHVIRHFDVTGKQCPAYFCYSDANNEDWKWFKEKQSDHIEDKDIISDNKFPHMVKIMANTLNVRVGAGVEYKIRTTVKKGEIYTIVEEKDGWGKLKSGDGWIYLDYVTKI